jgi:tetratricopeptide (TPR) repeat protein
MRWRVLVAAAVVAVSSACASTPEAGAFDLARAAYVAGDFAKAITHCDAAITAGERVAEATLLRGKCREKGGDANGALADYEGAIKIDSNLVEPVLRASRLHLALGSNDRARDAVETLFGGRYASLGARDKVLAHGMYGEVLTSWPDYANAVGELEKGIKLALDSGMASDPITTVMYYNLSRANFGRANYRRARDSFSRYLERSSGSAEDVYTLTVLHFLAGEVTKARSLAGQLPEELRAAADQILNGDALSVRALFEPAAPKDTENR